MLYLAECRIIETSYESDSKRYKKSHLVEANTESEAEQKLTQYYEKKNSAYCVSYSVDIIDISEVIS